MSESRNFEQHNEDNSDSNEGMYSSPIHLFESSSKRRQSGSPHELPIEFCDVGSFKKIIEKDNEDESENNEEGIIKIYDIEGNRICEFRSNEEFQDQETPIIEDKENDILVSPQLQTPLKNKELRSPLKDITPSITKKKKAAISTGSEKYSYLTPRTMAESRFSSGSGLSRIERL